MNELNVRSCVRKRARACVRVCVCVSTRAPAEAQRSGLMVYAAFMNEHIFLRAHRSAQDARARPPM